MTQTATTQAGDGTRSIPRQSLSPTEFQRITGCVPDEVGGDPRDAGHDHEWGHGFSPDGGNGCAAAGCVPSDPDAEPGSVPEGFVLVQELVEDWRFVGKIEASQLVRIAA